MARTAFAAATRSWLSYAWSASSVSAVGNSTSTAPGVTRRCTGKPLRRKTSIIRWFSGSTCAWNVEMPASPAASARCATRMEPETVALELVGDAHAHLGAGGSPPLGCIAHRRPRRPPSPRGEGQQREVVPVVDLRRPSRDLAHVDGDAAEPEVAGLVGETDQVVLDPFAIVGARGPDAYGGPVPKDDVDRSMCGIAVGDVGHGGAPIRRCRAWSYVERGTRRPRRAARPRAWTGCSRRSS